VNPTAERLRQILEGSAGPEGWPYYPQRASRVESTCWALLALSAVGARSTLRSGLSFLRRLRRSDGLLVEPETPGPNYAWNGLTLLTALATEGTGEGAWRDRISASLIRAKGIALAPGPSPIRQNGQLQAWSWVDGTFSWIEPTALCLLALKKARTADVLALERMRDAEAVILDRVCNGGGWNYGNAQVFDQDLRPYVPTTGLALLAMQDRRSHAAVQQSLSWLTAHSTVEFAAMALSLATICLHTYGLPTESVRAALIDLEAKTRFLGNLHLSAMALYALTVPEHGARAFLMGAE
jgi:hypothetical protein